MAQKSVLVKKYENRRLYDVSNSRYVNLEEVAQMLRAGDDVRVVDAVSGEDITRLVLTQIIVEGAKTPDSSFPLDILRQMVIASGRVSQEGAMRYMKAMLDLYQNAYRAMTPAFNPFDFVSGAPPSAAFHAAKAGNGVSVEKEGPEEERKADEVNGLKQRVAELEKLVSTMSAAAPQDKRPAARGATRKGGKRTRAES